MRKHATTIAIALSAMSVVASMGASSAAATSSPHAASPSADVAPPLTRLSGMTVDQSGDVYVSDDAAGDDEPVQVVEATPAGRQIELNVPCVYEPGFLSVNGVGDLYVDDPDGAGVVERQPSGAVRDYRPGPDATHYEPYSVAADDSGDVYAINHPLRNAPSQKVRVVEQTVAGKQKTLPFTGLSRPAGIAVHAGVVYVADAGNNRVVELTKSGAQKTLPFKGYAGPVSVAVDSAGDVYAYNDGSQVAKLSPAGKQTMLTFPVSAGQELGVDAAGDVYIGMYSDVIYSTQHEVQVDELTPSGAVKTITFPGGATPDTTNQADPTLGIGDQRTVVATGSVHTLSGSADPGSYVFLYLGTQQLADTQACWGTYSFTQTINESGDYSVRTESGQQSHALGLRVVTPTLHLPAGQTHVSEGLRTISGAAPARAKVKLFRGKTQLATTTAGADSRYSLRYRLTSSGTYRVKTDGVYSAPLTIRVSH